MTNERLTIEEIEHKYPDEWLLIVDYELSENTELLSGRLIAHSKSRKEIRDISMNYTGRSRRSFYTQNARGCRVPIIMGYNGKNII